MENHQCNLFETSNGQCVGYAHVYLELKEGNVDFTDLELVLADDQELVRVEQSDVGMVEDGKLQRNTSGGTSEGFIKGEKSERELSDGKETGHIDDKDEDNTVVDKIEDTANEGSIKVEEESAPQSPNFEESLTESTSPPPPYSSSGWGEDTNLHRGLQYSIFEKYFADTSLSRGSDRKKEIVECKLCRETGKVTRITRDNISKHMRSVHLPEEECKVCGKSVKSRKMPQHKIWCGSRCERSNHDFPHEGICKLELTKKPSSRSKNCPYCEKPILKKNFNRDFETHLRISCPESPVKITSKAKQNVKI